MFPFIIFSKLALVVLDRLQLNPLQMNTSATWSSATQVTNHLNAVILSDLIVVINQNKFVDKFFTRRKSVGVIAVTQTSGCLRTVRRRSTHK
jgi:hypothetical protein